MRSLVLVVIACCSFAAEPPTIQRLPGDDILAWVQIPDLKRLIEHVEASADRFAAAAGEEAPLAEAFGQVFGEAEMQALKPGAPIALLVFAPAKGAMEPDAAWFIPVTDAAPLLAVAGRMNQQAAAVGSLVLVADNPARLERAKAFVPTWQALAAAPADTDVRIHLSLARAMQQWGPMAEMGIGVLAAAAAAQNPQQGAQISSMLTLELHGLMHVMKQVADVQIDLTTGADRFDARIHLGATAGSPLAGVLAAVPPGAGETVRMLSPGPAMMAFDARFDGLAVGRLVEDVLDHLAKKPATQALMLPETVETLKPALLGWSGAMAMRMDIAADGSLITEAVASVRDAAVGQALVDAFTSLLDPEGAIGRMYREAGIAFQVQPAAREHAGVPVHRLFTDLDATKVDPEQAKVMQSFLSDTDFAIDGGWYLSSSEPAGLDALIDRARTGAPAGGPVLKAVAHHGPGQGMYADYDIAVLAGAMMARFMPGAPPAPAAGSSDPVTIAMRWADGIGAYQVRVPFAPIVDLITAAQQHAAPPAEEPVDEQAPTF